MDTVELIIHNVKDEYQGNYTCQDAFYSNSQSKFTLTVAGEHKYPERGWNQRFRHISWPHLACTNSNHRRGRGCRSDHIGPRRALLRAQKIWWKSYRHIHHAPHSHDDM